MNNQTKTISIVLPVYNEELGLANVLERIFKLKSGENNLTYEVIVVDNNSTDKSVNTAQQYPVKILHESKQGYGAAYKTGLSSATGDILVTMDADGTYPVEEIPKFVALLTEKNVDFITTNRFPSGYINLECMPLTNRVGNILLTSLFKIIYGVNIKDSQSGMWILTKNIFNQMQIHSDGMQFSQEIKIEATYYLKCKWEEIPIKYENRIGHKKLKVIKDGTDNLKHLVQKKLHR